jgi:ubiquinone/menaquinone biosynthesis C-methylase UbiE
MGIRERLQAGLARQLGRPSGPVGRAVIARRLNKINRATVTAAVDVLDLRPGEAAADIGFGGGVGLGVLLDRLGLAGKVHGVDISPDMITRAARQFRRERRRLELHQGSITDLPLADASIDAAICINIIYFVADPDRAFAELARVLRPAGRIVLGVFDPVAMADLPFTRFGFRIRPVEELTAGLAAAGLPVADHRRLGPPDRTYHLLVARRQNGS